MIRILALVLALVWTPIELAAQEQPIFKDYDEMRSTLDELMMARQIEKMMLRFGGPSDMSKEDLKDFELRIRDRFPRDFDNVDVVRVQTLENGWSQEMYAYYSGLGYIFVAVLLHQRADQLIVLNIRFDVNFHEVKEYF